MKYYQTQTKGQIIATYRKTQTKGSILDRDKHLQGNKNVYLSKKNTHDPPKVCFFLFCSTDSSLHWGIKEQAEITIEQV